MNERKQKVKWIAILWYIYIHVLGVYAIWLMFTSAKWMTIFYSKKIFLHYLFFRKCLINIINFILFISNHFFNV